MGIRMNRPIKQLDPLLIEGLRQERVRNPKFVMLGIDEFKHLCELAVIACHAVSAIEFEHPKADIVKEGKKAYAELTYSILGDLPEE